MADASWLPDPSGTHELRYWNGTAWTEHVSDQGTTGIDAPQAAFPPPAPAAPPPPPPAPPASGHAQPPGYGQDPHGQAPHGQAPYGQAPYGQPPYGQAPGYGQPAAPPAKPSWKDRLKQVADQSRAVAEQSKQKIAEQQAKRTAQWADDPNTLWSGESKNAATSATGISKARYRVTRDRIWIESGLLGTKTENVPMWAVKDIDVRQAVWQRGKDIGDVVLTLEDPSYTADPTGMFSLSGVSEGGHTSGQVVLDNIENPYGVVDIISPLISEARHKKTVERQSQYVHHVNPGAAYGAPAPAPAEPQPDLVDQLRRLGELRDAGILTEDEFAAQKAKLLG